MKASGLWIFLILWIVSCLNVESGLLTLPCKQRVRQEESEKKFCKTADVEAGKEFIFYKCKPSIWSDYDCPPYMPHTRGYHLDEIKVERDEKRNCIFKKICDYDISNHRSWKSYLARNIDVEDDMDYYDDDGMNETDDLFWTKQALRTLNKNYRKQN